MFINETIHRQVLVEALDSHVRSKGASMAETVAVLLKVVQQAPLVSIEKEAECIQFLKDSNTTDKETESGGV